MKRALVVGCAACIWEDVRAAQELCQFDAVVCVKLAGAYWPTRFDVWAGLHPEYMPEYIAKRNAMNYPGGYEVVAPLESEIDAHNRKFSVNHRVAYRWNEKTRTGSSGLYGAKVALDYVGATHVVLAGIPMDDQEHFTRGKPWREGVSGSYRHGWEDALVFLTGRVKSVSGWTREILGAPTREWIAGKA